jgi:hypothetical protein
MKKLNPAQLTILELFLQEAKEPKVTWAQTWRVGWVFSASKPSKVKFGRYRSAIMTTGIIHVHRKSHPWMMMPKSQFLLGKHRDNVSDKIILTQ